MEANLETPSSSWAKEENDAKLSNAKDSRIFLTQTKNMTDEKIFKCDICCMTFKNKVNKTAHIERVHGNLKHYICELCKQTFYGKKGLEDHTYRVHSSIKRLKCELFLVQKFVYES